MRRLAVIGASGHGKVVADIAESCGWEAIDFFDDGYRQKTVNENWPIVGDLADLLAASISYAGVVVAIGDNEVRRRVCETVLANSIVLVTLIHPAAVVSRYAQIGDGSVVVAGAVINAYAVIGRGVIINTCASIDHDCCLGDYVHISPGAHLAGGVNVGHGSWVGIGSCIKQQVTVGTNVRVGAGAVVINDVQDNFTVAGVPARSLNIK